jgi:ATP-dependent DNA helicase RecG
MLEWKYQTGNEVLFESTVDKTKFTFMLDEKNAETIQNNTETIQKQRRNNIETTEKQHRNNGDKLTKNQLKIIENITYNPFITSKELSQIIGITSDNILVNISKLKKQGIIRREGADKGGKWVIINEEK